MIVPVRVEVDPVLGATVNVTVPLPPPELFWTVIHELPLVEDQPQLEAVVTLTFPLPPLAAMVKAAGLTEKLQAAVAVVNVKLRVIVALAESLTIIVKVNVPAWAGVPESMPVDVSDRPYGSVPVYMLQM